MSCWKRSVAFSPEGTADLHSALSVGINSVYDGTLLALVLGPARSPRAPLPVVARWSSASEGVAAGAEPVPEDGGSVAAAAEHELAQLAAWVDAAAGDFARVLGAYGENEAATVPAVHVHGDRAMLSLYALSDGHLLVFATRMDASEQALLDTGAADVRLGAVIDRIDKLLALAAGRVVG